MPDVQIQVISLLVLVNWLIYGFVHHPRKDIWLSLWWYCFEMLPSSGKMVSLLIFCGCPAAQSCGWTRSGKWAAASPSILQDWRINWFWCRGSSLPGLSKGRSHLLRRNRCCWSASTTPRGENHKKMRNKNAHRFWIFILPSRIFELFTCKYFRLLKPGGTFFSLLLSRWISLTLGMLAKVRFSTYLIWLKSSHKL